MRQPYGQWSTEPAMRRDRARRNAVLRFEILSVVNGNFRAGRVRIDREAT